jgi:hypothetical protein
MGQFGARINQHVETFARNQSTHAHYQRCMGIEPKSVSNLAALALPYGDESVGVDTWRNDDRRKVSPRASARFCSGIPAGSNDDLGPTQDAAQNRTSNWQPPGNGHFCAMNDNPIGPFKPRPNDAEGNCGIEQHKVSIDLCGQAVNASGKRASRQQYLRRIAFNANRLLRVECFCSAIRSREHSC